MDIENSQKAITKILDTTLTKEFDFIDGVKDVVLTISESGLYGQLKLKIILNRDWVEKNFIEDAIKYINDDFENDGYSLLGSFSVESFSKGLIDHKEIESYVSTMLNFLGLNVNMMSINITYIIE